MHLSPPPRPGTPGLHAPPPGARLPPPSQGWYDTIRVMYCIVPIQYCNAMYCISNVSDKVVVVHKRYGPILCCYSVLVYNLQLLAKKLCAFFFFSGYILFYICLTWLMTLSMMSMMMSSVTSLTMSSGMISSVMCPITLHHKQTFHIHILRARPPRSRLLSTLGGLANSRVGGMPPGEVRSGFLDTSEMLFSSLTFADSKNGTMWHWPRDIALSVHSTPTVASAAERNWSVFGFIRSKSRNRLHGH